MDNKVLVNNIKKICQERQISISQLERDLYMSSGLISRWAKNIPTLDRVMDIADYFGVSLDVLTRDPAAAHSSNRTLQILLNTLYQQSIDSVIEWDILDIRHPLPNISSDKLEIFANKTDTDCFYCAVNQGYFFLVIRYDEAEHTELFLYVLANSRSYPELKCNDTEKLTKLYTYLSKRLSRQLNTLKSDQFITDFIENAQNTSDSTSGKVTPMKIISNA